MATVARRERGEHTPWDMVCEMESPISAITDYASMLSLISADEDLGEDVQAPISRVARDIKARAKEVEEWRGKLFHALHPNRDEPDFQDDGNGEVEEAEGDAS